MNKSLATKNYTFEQLCIRREIGFSCDLGTMFMPFDPDNFDDVVFKIISKIDTSLLLLKTHGGEVKNFTVIAVPLVNHENEDLKDKGKYQRKAQSSKNIIVDLSALHSAWEYLETDGWHGLQCIALLRLESIPDNGSRIYNLYDYTTSIMDVIRANYMFQKHRSSFHHETLETFDESAIKEAKQVIFGLIWKKSIVHTRGGGKLMNMHTIQNPITQPPRNQPTKELPIVRNTKRLKKVDKHFSPGSYPEEGEDDVEQEIVFREPVLCQENKVTPVVEKTTLPVSRGRMKSIKFAEETEKEMEWESEESPAPVRTTRRGHKAQNNQIAPVKEEKSIETDGVKSTETIMPTPAVLDVTLGFETSLNTTKVGRKSMAGRKSLSSDWPEEERQSILDIFDDLNPSATEQKKIAYTCKYVALVMQKDLPSKLLYQWVQKKGRVVKKAAVPAASVSPEAAKNEAVRHFRQLSDTNSDAARVAFTIMYMDVQLGVSVTAKQMFAWIEEKQKPAAKRSGRRN